MRTVQVLIGGTPGIVPIQHIELAHVIREGVEWKVRMCLVSGQTVTSVAYDCRYAAERALRKLFLDYIPSTQGKGFG